MGTARCRIWRRRSGWPWRGSAGTLAYCSGEALGRYPAINRRYWESLERGESGEGVDLVKKHGGQAACAESAQGDHFPEGLAEVRMDYNDAPPWHCGG